ncbi:MAG TPA: branched-chain amino acid ABC transporter permease [Chloroflexota bacterium]|nr:branched-chain amino acid ABC transporter permease [Chloroflexota bacterium]
MSAETAVPQRPPPTSRAGAASWWRARSGQQRRLVWFGLALLLALLYPFIDGPLLAPLFGGSTLGIMIPVLIYTLLALGLNIVVGYAGLLDLGYAAFFAIGAYTAAFLTSPASPLPFRTDFWVALAASWAVASLFGIVLGAPTLRLRGDYLAIVTLAFGEIVPRVFLNLEQWTGGSKGMNPIGRPHILGYELGHDPVTLGAVTLSAQVPWYYLIVAVGIASIWAITRLYDSRLGRAWVAMREDEVAAASMGINLVQTKLLAFAMGASFSGFAGAIFASIFQFIDPFQFDFSISIMVLAMVILGGIGNVWGVLVGGLVLGLFDRGISAQLSTWLRGLGAAIGFEPLATIDLSRSRMLLFGLALVLLMLLRPQGLFPSAQRRAELTENEPEAPGELALDGQVAVER